jgi:protocatechuate 3,4-dioxygenase beta subunit
MKNQLLSAVVLVSLSPALLAPAQAQGTRPTNDKAANDSARFTPPPAGDEPAEVRELIDKAAAVLRSGTSASDVLSDPSYLPAHEWPRFRKLIRKFPGKSRLTLVSAQEPGDALTVSGRVVDRDGKPVPGAELYVYHTSAKGWYSDRAAHIQANEGDRKHARLFGYVTTDGGGKFELRTIRPGGYPESNLPCHIHVEVRPPRAERATMVTEILFDDDPRLTGPVRERSQREGFLIAPVRRDGGAAQRADVQLKLAQ